MDEEHQAEPQAQQPDPDLMEEEDDDLDDLGLFHKSSLKDKEEIPLPEHAEEVYGVKRVLNSSNESMIGEYMEHNLIGRGAFAEVLKVEKGGRFYAMKVYSLLKLRSQRFFAADGSFANGEEMLQNEVDIIKRLNHQNLIKCAQVLHGGNYIYVVGELCDLGQIMEWEELKNNYRRNPKVVDYISHKYGVDKIEDITRVVFLQAALGVQYMHSLNITNRDIKVDNILCMTSPLQGADIKIADFTTVRYSKEELSYFPSGTPGFRGPEQQFATSDGYSCKATDIWSLGISMYTFYTEFFPFMGESELEIDCKAQNQPLEFPEGTPEWLQGVINGMTAKEWKERMGIEWVISQLSAGQ